MSMYYSLVCIRCNKQLPIFRENQFRADPNSLIAFVEEHEPHGIILLDKDKADDFCIKNIVPVEWRGR